MSSFTLGFIINPIAGIGGSVALKGSDGESTVEQALNLGAKFKANERATTALSVLQPYKELLTIKTAAANMGENCAKQLGFNVEVVYQSHSEKTSALDTENAVNILLNSEIDLLLFAGGDGTARNVCQQISDYLTTSTQNNQNKASSITKASLIPVLGIPAGCKIHSSVYAVSPTAAGKVAELMLTNQLVSLTDADVMDIDESLFREGIVKAKRFGEMTIPLELRYMQAVKSGGKEVDELVLSDIAADIIEKMDDELFIIGSGSTTQFIMNELGVESTLLGVDVVQNEKLLVQDITEPKLWALIQHYSPENIKLVITLIGGQGHIFGRGNQQLSPRIIEYIGKSNILIVATKTKLTALNSRPLLVDTGDSKLDKMLSGYLPITTGYHDQVLYPVSSVS